MKTRLTLMMVAALVLVACGGEDRMLAGFRREPAPNVSSLSLPDLSNGGDEFALQADPGELLVVYFGYTNCPDFCPTTMSDVRFALQEMDEPERVEVAMVGVDPARDMPVLADYVDGFVPGGHALSTDDEARLAQVAAPFGAQFEIATSTEGEPEVAHTTALYVVDDRGELALSWPFGVTVDDLAADFEQLLDLQEQRA